MPGKAVSPGGSAVPETVEQERTRYRRAYEGLRKEIEAEIGFCRSIAEDVRWDGQMRNARQAMAVRLQEILNSAEA